jgi:hypothetical protein
MEDHQLLAEISQLGSKWTLIAERFNGRSSNDVKNRWYTHLKDISVRGEDGEWRIVRDSDGSIVGQKKKRKRRLVSAFDAAVDRNRRQHQKTFEVTFHPLALLNDQPFQLPPLLPRPRSNG